MPTTYEPYLTSFEDVSSMIHFFDKTETMEHFDSPLRHPEYIILYEKFVVNLKKKWRSTKKPMGAFELYVEGSSKETAIELKIREKEMLDLIQRELEGFTYEELATTTGKQKLKLVLRKQINLTLNKGWVKRFYFKSFIIKP